MKRLALLLALGAVFALIGGSSAPAAPSASNATVAQQCMVIYSVYRNVLTGSPTYDHQYVNLLNRCGVTVDISALNWKFRSTSSSGSFNDVCANTDTAITNCMLPGGTYWLIKLNNGVGSGGALPTPDHTEGTNIIGGTGDVTVWIDNTNNVTDCSGSHVDLLGFAGATPPCAETASGPTPANSNEAVQRKLSGCQDTDDNSMDFVAETPTPHNSAFAPVTCATAAVLAGASATRSARGVLVRWSTATETGVLGFHVYRESAGKLVRVSPSLIRAAFVGARGLTHTFVDRTAPHGRVVYRVQSVGLDGRRAWLARVVVRR